MAIGGKAGLSVLLAQSFNSVDFFSQFGKLLSNLRSFINQPSDSDLKNESVRDKSLHEICEFGY